METGEVEAWPNIDSCVILTGSQGKGLLNPGPGEELSDDKKIQIQLQEGEVGLAPCTVMLCLHACHGPVASHRTCQLGEEVSDDNKIQIQLQDGEVWLDTSEDWCPAPRSVRLCLPACHGPLAGPSTCQRGLGALCPEEELDSCHAGNRCCCPCCLLMIVHAGEPAVQHPGVIHRTAVRPEAGFPAAGSGYQPGHRAACAPYQAGCQRGLRCRHAQSQVCTEGSLPLLPLELRI